VVSEIYSFQHTLSFVMIGICLQFYILIVWLISSSIIITRFEFVFNADDYDRSINEAIKITKYASDSFLDNSYS